jgi:hypothetical protein
LETGVERDGWDPLQRLSTAGVRNVTYAQLNQ